MKQNGSARPENHRQISYPIRDVENHCTTRRAEKSDQYYLSAWLSVGPESWSLTHATLTGLKAKGKKTIIQRTHAPDGSPREGEY
jgi:hypothetical protein